MKVILLLFVAFMLLRLNAMAESGINFEKVVVNHNVKIQKLNQRYKSLLNEIDQLKEQQNNDKAKIRELFRLLEFKQTKEVVEQTVTQIRKDNVKAKRLYSNARNLLLTDQFKQAIIVFKQYLNDYPDNSNADDAHYWLARSYYSLQDYKNAKQTFIAFQQDNPKHHKFSNSLIELARVHIEMGENENAVELLNLMIRKTPNHSSINKAKRLLNNLLKAIKEPSK